MLDKAIREIGEEKSFEELHRKRDRNKERHRGILLNYEIMLTITLPMSRARIKKEAIKFEGVSQTHLRVVSREMRNTTREMRQ
jgi:hypothetical protein